MVSISALRGMLLEEAILFLLRASGYQTITDVAQDTETLGLCSSGLVVKGRGGSHQIDAIADFAFFSPPFSYPQRLLVEAKCYKPARKVGIEIIRNAVGVLKDVGEFWVTRTAGVPKKKYRYQFAVFSTSGFTSGAEKYSYAQDIYLMNLTRTIFFKPIVTTIRAIPNEVTFCNRSRLGQKRLTCLRKEIREYLQRYSINAQSEPNSLSSSLMPYSDYLAECIRLNQAYLAVLAYRFPIFLVPSPGFVLSEINSHMTVRIYWDNQAWYLRDSNGRNLFFI